MDTKKIIEPARQNRNQRNRRQIVMGAFLALLFGFGLWSCIDEHFLAPSSRLAQYRVLREYKPYDGSNAWAVDILLLSKHDKAGIEKFLYDLGRRRAKVNVNVFTTEAAQRLVSDQAVDEGLLCLYSKDASVNRNEIKWMQKKGDFAKFYMQYSTLGRR
jgi:hypothetical protein